MIMFAALTAMLPFSAATYNLNQDIRGSSFFDSFDFYTGDDPTHGTGITIVSIFLI